MMNESTHQELEQHLFNEVVAFHEFIAQWFRGEVEDDAPLFDHHMKQKLAPDFINIQPLGAGPFPRAIARPYFSSTRR